MDTERKVYHPLTIPIIRYAREKGVSHQTLSEVLDQDSSHLNSSDYRLGAERFKRLLMKVVSNVGDNHLGLDVGESLRSGNLGIIGFVLMNCGNLLEALKKYHDYYKIVSNITQLSIHAGKRHIRLQWTFIDENLMDFQQLILQGIMASLRKLAQEWTGKQLPMAEIHFNWPEPTDVSEYERIFETRLKFDQATAAVILDSDVARTSFAVPNAELLSVFENHARERYLSLSSEEPYSGEVLSVLTGQHDEMPGIESVADIMGLSVRNLQLKLKKESAMFRELRDRVRYDLARIYLRDPQCSNEEISYRLGFSEPSAFYRAFKRWTGRKPSEFRPPWSSVNNALFDPKK